MPVKIPTSENSVDLRPVVRLPKLTDVQARNLLDTLKNPHASERDRLAAQTLLQNHKDDILNVAKAYPTLRIGNSFARGVYNGISYVLGAPVDLSNFINRILGLDEIKFGGQIKYGGSEHLKDLTKKYLVPDPKINDEITVPLGLTPSERIAERIGEEIGAGAAIVPPVAKLAEAFPAVGKVIGNPLSPKNAAAELGSATGAGIGAGLALEAGAGPTGEMTGALAGAFGPSVVAGVGSKGAGVAARANSVIMDTLGLRSDFEMQRRAQGAAKTVAADIIRKNTHDPEQALNNIKRYQNGNEGRVYDKPGEYEQAISLGESLKPENVPTWVTAEDLGLRNLTKALSAKYPGFSAKLSQIHARQEAALNRTIHLMHEQFKSNPSKVKKVAEDYFWQLESELDRTNSRIHQEIMDIVGGNPAEMAEKVREIILLTREHSREISNKAWEKFRKAATEGSLDPVMDEVPPTVPGSRPEATREILDKWHNQWRRLQKEITYSIDQKQSGSPVSKEKAQKISEQIAFLNNYRNNYDWGSYPKPSYINPKTGKLDDLPLAPPDIRVEHEDLLDEVVNLRYIRDENAKKVKALRGRKWARKRGKLKAEYDKLSKKQQKIEDYELNKEIGKAGRAVNMAKGNLKKVFKRLNALQGRYEFSGTSIEGLPTADAEDLQKHNEILQNIYSLNNEINKRKRTIQKTYQAAKENQTQLGPLETQIIDTHQKQIDELETQANIYRKELEEIRNRQGPEIDKELQRELRAEIAIHENELGHYLVREEENAKDAILRGKKELYNYHKTGKFLREKFDPGLSPQEKEIKIQDSIKSSEAKLEKIKEKRAYHENAIELLKKGERPPASAEMLQKKIRTAENRIKTEQSAIERLQEMIKKDSEEIGKIENSMADVVDEEAWINVVRLRGQINKKQEDIFHHRGLIEFQEFKAQKYRNNETFDEKRWGVYFQLKSDMKFAEFELEKLKEGRPDFDVDKQAIAAKEKEISHIEKQMVATKAGVPLQSLLTPEGRKLRPVMETTVTDTSETIDGVKPGSIWIPSEELQKSIIKVYNQLSQIELQALVVSGEARIYNAVQDPRGIWSNKRLPVLEVIGLRQAYKEQIELAKTSTEKARYRRLVAIVDNALSHGLKDYPEIKQLYDLAMETSQIHNSAFSTGALRWIRNEGVVGKINRNEVPGSSTLRKMLHTGYGSKEDAKSLRQVMSGVIERNGTIVRGRMKNDDIKLIREYLSRIAYDFSSDSNGRINPEKFHRWVKNFREVIRVFPEVRDDMTNLSRLADFAIEHDLDRKTRLTRIVEQRHVTLLLEDNPVGAIKEVFSGKFGSIKARKLSEIVSKSVEAQIGLKQAFWDYFVQKFSLGNLEIVASPVTNAKNVVDFVDDKTNRDIMIALGFTPPEIGNIKVIADNIFLAQQTARAISQKADLSDIDVKSLDLGGVTVSGLASRFYSIARNVVSPRFIATEMSARLVNSRFNQFTMEETRRLLEESLVRPEMAEIMLRPINEKTIDEITRQLRLHLISLGWRAQSEE